MASLATCELCCSWSGINWLPVCYYRSRDHTISRRNVVRALWSYRCRISSCILICSWALRVHRVSLYWNEYVLGARLTGPHYQIMACRLHLNAASAGECGRVRASAGECSLEGRRKSVHSRRSKGATRHAHIRESTRRRCSVATRPPPHLAAPHVESISP